MINPLYPPSFYDIKIHFARYLKDPFLVIWKNLFSLFERSFSRYLKDPFLVIWKNLFLLFERTSFSLFERTSFSLFESLLWERIFFLFVFLRHFIYKYDDLCHQFVTTVYWIIEKRTCKGIPCTHNLYWRIYVERLLNENWMSIIFI